LRKKVVDKSAIKVTQKVLQRHTDPLPRILEKNHQGPPPLILNLCASMFVSSFLCKTKPKVQKQNLQKRLKKKKRPKNKKTEKMNE
jgi:hypothetical protein